VFNILARITKVNLSSITVTHDQIELAANSKISASMHKMPVFIGEAVALVVLMFSFLVLELQTQVSRFQTLLNRNFVEDWWKKNFRISRPTFDYIVRVVGPDLAKKTLRECIPVRVAVALWGLAAGDTYRSTGVQFGI